jgi:hypothetical protein
MASRALAGVLLLTVILMSSVTPAEACALWCSGSHGGGQRHDQPMLTASSMQGHHHDHSGMQHLQSPGRVTAAICQANCRGMGGEVSRKSLPREKCEGRVGLQEVGADDLLVTERDGNAVNDFASAGPPGLAGFTVSVLRV